MLRLQVAADAGPIDDAIAVLQEIAPSVDTIQCGAALIKHSGISAITHLKESSPSRQILADLKSIDRSEFEANMAFTAGADYTTVLGVANDLTIKGPAAAALSHGKSVIADLINVSDRVPRAKGLKLLGVNGLEIHCGLDEQVITVYSAAFLAALPLTTWLARRMGHRNHLVLSILLYGAGAFGCFLSHDLWQLLLSRAFMGFGGGAFLVRSEATIYRLFQGKQRGQFMLLFGTFLNGSKALTPLVFGFVTDSTSWNAAFLLLIPVALSAALIVYVFIPDRMHFNPERPRPDFVGISLFLCAVTAFQVNASRGEQDNWLASPHLRLALTVALVSTVLFMWWDTHSQNANPLLNFRLIFSERSLSTGLGVAFVFGALLSSGLYVLPQYLRGIESYNATQTGGFFFVDGIATLAGMFLAGLLIPLWKLKPVMLLAFAFFLVGNLLFVSCLTTDTPASILCGLLCFHGISVGILLPAVANYLLGQLELRLISFGAAIYLFFRQLGSSIGVSITVTLIDLRETLHSSRLLDSANRFNPPARSLLQSLTNLLHTRGPGTNTSTLGAAQLFSGLVSTQSRLLAFIDVFWVLQFLAVIGALFQIRAHKSATPLANATPRVFHA